MKTITEAISKLSSNRRLADFLFILWAGGAALLSYSLVYTLRKPFTAATFDGIEAFGFDYKVLVTIIQIAGYLIAKFIGIRLISELKRENCLKFILVSIAVAELSLVAFGALPTPYNMFAMFFNGLSLGCMWGVIFSFIEGRRTTVFLGESFRNQYCYQFGNGKIHRIVRYEYIERQRILDAGTYRCFCTSFIGSFGI